VIDVNNIVHIENYGDYSSENYGSSRCVRINNLTIYFSYSTVIGFADSTGIYITENTWGPTTGKHLNWVNRSQERLPREKFEEKLKEAFIRHGIINAKEEIANNL
jgi:hypothetical protein